MSDLLWILGGLAAIMVGSIVITDAELINQHDGRPITFRAANLLLRRPT